jgi:hypothetical protein
MSAPAASCCVGLISLINGNFEERCMSETSTRNGQTVSDVNTGPGGALWMNNGGSSPTG